VLINGFRHFAALSKTSENVTKNLDTRNILFVLTFTSVSLLHKDQMEMLVVSYLTAAIQMDGIKMAQDKDQWYDFVNFVA
jgi:hypothetical protein